MGKGRERNGLCWCNSGKKYKNCHLKIENNKKIEMYEVENDFKESHSKKTCMAPREFHNNCSKKIIRAHTISKSSNLKQISKDGHVLGFKRTINELNIHNGKFSIEKIGINKASIYNNFCSIHDKKLFAVIEDEDFIFTSKQIFMLAYRAICKELYLKYCSSTSNQNLLKYQNGLDINMQKNIANVVDFFNIETGLAVRDLEKLKLKYDEYIINNNFDNIKYYCLLLDKVPELMSSCGWIPTEDFNSNKLADLSKEEQIFNTLTVSTVAIKDNGAIIFAWLDNFENNFCDKFIDSFNKIPNNEKSSAILNWLFLCNENIYFSENWWNNLDLKKQELIQKLTSLPMLSYIGLNNYSRFEGVVDWNILEINTNI